MSQTYNFGGVFTFSKDCVSKNLLNFIRFYIMKIQWEDSIENIFKRIKEFIDSMNLVFPDSRRNILNKPSFLNEGNSYTHETEMMTAKKLRVIEKSVVADRNHILTIFIRKMLKNLLMAIRTKTLQFSFKMTDVYCIIQVCYEMGNVEEEGQISAFYYLLNAGIHKKEEETKR